MNPVRFGIIGLGFQGSLYASILTGKPHPGRPHIPQPENCVLTAISSRSPGSRDRAEELGVRWFSDWKELIDSGSCDAIIITVPHWIHHEIAVHALEREIHVLCEKPAGVRASDVCKMLDAQLVSGASLGMFFHQRANPMFRRIKQIIDSGELGALRRSNWIVNHYWRPDSYYTSASWRGTWSGEGGGLLVNQLPHYLDLWLYLCGVPSRIYAANRYGAYRRNSVENDVSVLAEYPNGTTGVFVACSHDPMGTDRLELDFDQGKILVENSTHATIHRFRQPEQVWNNTVSFVEMQRMTAQNADHHDTEEIVEEIPFGVSHARLIGCFASHILNGTPMLADGDDGLIQVELANAIQYSGWIGQAVTFPCDWDAYNRLLQQRMDQETG